ncbi:MAG: 4-alpha-glucanotransferase, partial [Gemmatimonadetes bacterium]|nr:4-alpha-glucanotransferase [Gemmatimonadota bacterium]
MRKSGLLLHPTSLPGPFASGDLGPSAHAFVDFLAQAGQSVWQVLPLGPTGYGDSPYQCFSAFAGQPLLVSPEMLAEQGLLSRHDLSRLPVRHESGTDYGAAVQSAALVAEQLAAHLSGHAAEARFEAWRAATPWLAEHTRFMAIREAHGGRPWHEWPEALRLRDAAALAEADRTLASAMRRHAAMQWAFAEQWAALRAHAHANGVQLLGDAPIFVAFDSTDVWASPGLFELDAQGRPTGVAGVPPDYFSETGQLWGNPLYRWGAHAASGYAWWIARLRALLGLVDCVRLDHFIGFVRYWEVPPDAPDARPGQWRPGPGRALFDALASALGGLPLVAEDLGETGPEVEKLRDDLELPGMRILQFAFSQESTNPFLPENHVPNAVVYTGTHDNDTTLGWWQGASEAERTQAREVLGASSGDIAWDLIEAAMASVARTAIVPVQDVLSLGREARFNTPGKASGNWT